METTTPIQTASLADRARAAFQRSVAEASQELALRHREQIRLIREALAQADIRACAEPVVNPASGRACVPLILGGLTTEEWGDGEQEFTHTVAAEWDDDSPELGLLLVADRDPADEERHRSDWLYPAVRLTDLASIGVALEYGGHTAAESRVSTVGDLVGNAIRAAGAFSRADGYEAQAMVHAADAICIALQDVAAAIREIGAAPVQTQEG